MTALIHLSTQIASSSSAISFTSGLTSTYKRYSVEFSDVVASTEAHFELSVSTDGGSTWQADPGAYSWESSEIRKGVVSGRSAVRDTRVMLTGGRFLAGDGGSDGLCGTLNLSNPAGNADRQLFFWQGALMSRLELLSISGAGAYRTATAINGIRFKFSNGTITRGTFSLYGLATS